MFDGDKWLEIFGTLVKNPLRSLMIILAVGIGMFILVILQGMGTGLENGVSSMFADDAVNSIWVRSSTTSLSYGGYKPNRRVRLKESDHRKAADDIQGTAISSARQQMWGVGLTFGSKTGNYSLRAVHPNHQEVEKTEMHHGRYINQRDLDERRKVAVLGGTIVDELFGGGNPVGQFVDIMGIRFKVVGSYNDPASRWENRVVYIPIKTGQAVFWGNTDDISMFIVSTEADPLEATQETATTIDGYLRSRHTIHPEDQRALSVNNNNEEFKRISNILLGMRVFLFVIGGLTLVSGIIGVSTIMGIIVQDRRREFGIRKSIGATPGSVVTLIVMEAVFIALMSGLLGLLLAVALLELFGGLVDHPFFQNPRLSLNICLSALGILVLAGVVAGLIPGVRAARIKPIEALKET